MNTRIVPIDEKDPAADGGILAEAALLIRSGELVAFPTETVYGLGADAENTSASSKIYEAKGRPSDNPLIVHIADIERLYDAADGVNPTALSLAEAFWPGPLTLILPRNGRIPRTTTGGLDTVAVRMPSHPVAAALIRASGCMIAAPSANASGRPSPTAAGHVLKDLDGRIPLILDGGPVGIGIESTIVDCTSGEPVILRPGYITRDMIADVCGQCSFDPALLAGRDIEKIRPKAPGMKYRHYAPKAPLSIVEGDRADVVRYINSELKDRDADKIGILASDETAGSYTGGHVIALGSIDDTEAIARSLYAALRSMDDLLVEEIFSESFRTQGIGDAVMNRLTKASGYKKIQV